MQKHVVTLMVCGLMLGAAGQAAAQAPQWSDRAYFGVNFAVESGSTALEGSQTFNRYDEPALLTTTGKGDAGPMFDLSVGARVWRNVSVGIGFQQMSSKADATVGGSIPHPLFYNRPRTVAETLPSLARSESAIHLQFGYMWTVSEKLDVLIYGGPSFFRVSQDTLSSVEVGERGAPFDSVIVVPTVQKQKQSPVGGHIGADVTYKLYHVANMTFGAGGFLRWAGASTDFRVLDSDVSSDVGGVQAGFGLRIRY